MQLKKAPKIDRNLPCPCGSDKKYKKCCLSKQREQVKKQQEAMKMLDKE